MRVVGQCKFRGIGNGVRCPMALHRAALSIGAGVLTTQMGSKVRGVQGLACELPQLFPDSVRFRQVTGRARRAVDQCSER